MSSQVLMVLADYGNDPTEVAIPFQVFTTAGLSVTIATENGGKPQCDRMMLEGWTGSLLGATKEAKLAHDSMVQSPAFTAPVSWSSKEFDVLAFDLVFLPGGHDKGMRQYIESTSLHQHLAKYVDTMRRPDSAKGMGAICHGVQVLAAANEGTGGKSIIHDFETTALPGFMEQSVFWATRLFLGDYYKTFGSGTPSVEEIVKNRLDNPAAQWKSSLGGQPFTHRDPRFRYISGRFPPDARLLAEQCVEMVKK